MSVFAELLWKQFPNIDFPGVDHSSVNKLTISWRYNSLYHISVRLIYHIYLLPYDDNKWNNNKSSYKNKFEVMDDVILNNKRITNCEIEYFFNKFNKAQNAYIAFRKIAQHCKYKYGKRFEIDADLCFNAFSQFSPKITISLLENNIIYKFRLSDLVNIINKSLTNAPHFFVEPLEVKNPYTNLPFSSCNLYNIYFKLKEINYVMPILFQQYFSSNFDLVRFKNYNECFIRDKAIDNFMKDASIDEQYQYILKMFYIHYRSVYFKIDPYFPRPKIVSVFKSYLHSFLQEEYSLNPYVRETKKIQLEYNLSIFSQLNPDFGKRIWVRKRPSASYPTTYSFHDNVISSFDSDTVAQPTPRAMTPIEYATTFHNELIANTEVNEREEEIDETDEADEADSPGETDIADIYHPEHNSVATTSNLQSDNISQTLLRYRRSYLASNNDITTDYQETIDETSESNESNNQVDSSSSVRRHSIDQILRDIY